jgi:hypothetical protein
MRANGVPNFPDLCNNGMRIEGGGQTISVKGISINAPGVPARVTKVPEIPVKSCEVV